MNKICDICNIEKTIGCFGRYKTKNGFSYISHCHTCHYAKYKQTDQRYRLIYRKSDRYYQNKREYENRPEVKAKRVAYLKKRRNNDILFRLRCNLRRRITCAFKSKGLNKDKQSIKYTGCDLKTLKEHIESKFKSGMTWDNYGGNINTWCIDHIIPLASAKTVEDLYKLCHYSNLQPLWFVENSKKGAKINGE